MDENTDENGYSETFRHEYGHFTDDMLGKVSQSEQFIAALEADKYWLDRERTIGEENFRSMLDHLEQTDALYSWYISDILSGVFLNDTSVLEMYSNNGIPFHGHEIPYWLEDTSDDRVIEREVFADLYAIYHKGEIADIDFVEQWFPNLSDSFLQELSGAAYG